MTPALYAGVHVGRNDSSLCSASRIRGRSMIATQGIASQTLRIGALLIVQGRSFLPLQQRRRRSKLHILRFRQA